jgi:hypothetical protein
MWLEGHHYGFAADRVGTLGDLPRNFEMGAVHAIEVTNTHYGRSEICRNIF